MTAGKAGTAASGLLALVALGAACGRSALGVGTRSDAAATATQDGPPAVAVANVSQPAVGGQCPQGFSGCGKGDGLRCYDVARSRDHCGACGHACAPGIACQAGACQQYACKGALSFKTLFTSSGYAEALADFDGDGILDLVGGPAPSGPMSLLYGAGDGTFPTRRDIDSSVSLGWLAVAADLDGDGFPELASIDGRWTPGASGKRAVTVRRGSEGRSAPLSDATDYPTGDLPASLFLADFDADGWLDLVVGESRTLEYWRGQDAGRFAQEATLAANGAMDSVSYAPSPLGMDWNGDGILDLVYTVVGNVHYRLGYGDGSFDSEVACSLATGALGDLDNDGRPDLITGSTLLLGIDGCHADKLVSLSDWPKQGSVALADFNGDGNLDVVADDDKAILVRVGDGQGGFAQSLSMSAPEAAQWPVGQFFAGDLNGDGKLDIVFARDGFLGVFLNTCR